MKNKKQTPVFSDHDPRSRFYARVLVTPTLRWGGIVLRCLLPLVVAAALGLLLWHFLPPLPTVLLCSGALLAYGLLRLKATLITWVQLYQVLAPKSIRNKCRFEPSCSQYMVLSLQKYGAIRGLFKGIGRLSRCNSRGNGLRGGFDDP